MGTTKKILFFAAMSLIACNVSAQFANTNSSNVNVSNNKVVNTTEWQRVYISYNPMNMIVDLSDADDMSFNGFSIGYAKGFSVSNDMPLFIETGAHATYGTNTLDSEDLESLEINNYKLEQKTTILNLNIPVNLAYKFSVESKKLSIIPYVGINFKGNIIGKSKLNLVDGLDSDDITEKKFWEYAEDSYGIKQEKNNFDKKDTGSKDSQWKRFQMGWQIGVGINYNKLYVGVSYGKDITELCKKTKLSTTSITLGYNF